MAITSLEEWPVMAKLHGINLSQYIYCLHTVE